MKRSRQIRLAVIGEDVLEEGSRLLEAQDELKTYFALYPFVEDETRKWFESVKVELSRFELEDPDQPW